MFDESELGRGAFVYAVWKATAEKFSVVVVWAVAKLEIAVGTISLEYFIFWCFQQSNFLVFSVCYTLLNYGLDSWLRL